MGAARKFQEPDIWEIFDLGAVATSDIQAYLDVTLAKCVAWFRASGGTIFLETAKDTYSLQSRCGQSIELPDSVTIRSKHGIAGIVVASGIGRIVDDPAVDPELADVKANARIKSSLVIPLIDSKRHVVGVLNISRRNGERPFTASDLDQAMALGAHVALAVANARMVTALQAEVGSTEIARAKLEAVLDSVAGAVVVVDADGEVVNHNSAARADSFLHHITDSELVPLTTSLKRTVRIVLETNERYSEQAYDEPSDRTWLVLAVPLSTGGAVVTVQEITEHERQQRELARVNRLAEIGQMTAAIAHEIRNPLTGIRSAAQMIREHPDTMPDFIGMIEEETLKLNALCDEFLDFARPVSLNRTETTLPDVINPVLTLLKPEFDAKGVKLQGETIGNKPKILIDGRKTSQVVLNMLRNALQATPPGGTVVCQILPTRVIVEDNGAGIPPENVEKLFTPFFTTKPDGTGLGLCNARKTVDAHGGEIRVESELGKGTKFEIIFDRNVI